MCLSSLPFTEFIVMLWANAVEETHVIPIEDKPCHSKEVDSGREFELVHKLGVPKPIQRY
jgi:hypothetical protein